MQFTERSYSGQLFRPRPEIHIENNGQLLLIATPWGPRSAAKKSIQIIQDYILSTQQDQEATAAFSYVPSLSPLGNHLRVAVKLANDAIYNEDNKNEYISGIELFALARNENEMVWVQAGYPFMFLDRPQRPLVALGTQQDLSVELSQGLQSLPPLPNKLLGLDLNSDFTVESIRPGAEDRFVFLARSEVPADFFMLSRAERSLENFSKVLSHHDANLPFWMGIFDPASV